jgi:hypothetical protein
MLSFLKTLKTSMRRNSRSCGKNIWLGMKSAKQKMKKELDKQNKPACKRFGMPSITALPSPHAEVGSKSPEFSGFPQKLDITIRKAKYLT